MDMEMEMMHTYRDVACERAYESAHRFSLRMDTVSHKSNRLLVSARKVNLASKLHSSPN